MLQIDWNIVYKPIKTIFINRFQTRLQLIWGLFINQVDTCLYIMLNVKQTKLLQQTFINHFEHSLLIIRSTLRKWFGTICIKHFEQPSYNISKHVYNQLCTMCISRLLNMFTTKLETCFVNHLVQYTNISQHISNL